MIGLQAIGTVHSARKEITDDLWLKEESYIELEEMRLRLGGRKSLQSYENVLRML